MKGTGIPTTIRLSNRTRRKYFPWSEGSEPQRPICDRLVVYSFQCRVFSRFESTFLSDRGPDDALRLKRRLPRLDSGGSIASRLVERGNPADNGYPALDSIAFSRQHIDARWEDDVHARAEFH